MRATLFWAQPQKTPKIDQTAQSLQKHTPQNILSQTETLQTFTIKARTQTALEEVRVNMAEKVESKPIELVTNVGSCVATCMHDSEKNVWGN